MVSGRSDILAQAESKETDVCQQKGGLDGDVEVVPNFDSMSRMELEAKWRPQRRECHQLVPQVA